MRNYLLVEFLIFYVVYFFTDLLKDLKFLQLEEYHVWKFLKCKFKQSKMSVVFNIISLILFLVLFFVGDFIKELLVNLFLVIIVIFAMNSIIKIKKYNIYPKFTKRICRIILTHILLSITILFVPYKYYIMSYIFIILPNIMLFVTITSNYIVCVLESFLCYFYAKKASKKIENLEIKKIAITGSYGKTSVKNILATLLEEKYCVCSSPKSYNTINGFSLTIRDCDLSNCDILIMEMGAKKRGDIEKLCNYFKPQFGILTAIEKQHLETFKSLDVVVETKKELQENLFGDSLMVFNCNNALVKKLYNEYNGCKISVGLDVDKFSVSAKNIASNIDGCCFDIFTNNDFFCRASCCLVGEHHIENILLAVAMAIQLGLTKSQIRIGISKLKPVDSRMQPILISNNNIVINNGYNSNPSSAKASLKLMALYNKTRVVVTCGFVEMGKEQYMLNKELGMKIGEVADIVYVVNKVNRNAILSGLKDVGYAKELYVVDKFKNIDFNKFVDSVILIENDLPDNYI